MWLANGVFILNASVTKLSVLELPIELLNACCRLDFDSN